MIKLFVDSGSSIKQNEKDIYGVEILPLKILLGNKEYLDGVDLELETFYNALIRDKIFPKTSLPSLDDTRMKVMEYVNKGDQVFIITISSKISGTFDTLNNLFKDEKNVKVFDSQTAVGGIKILALEAKKYLDSSLDFIESKLNEIAPRITALAVPETLEYLKRGGRLSATSCAIGTLLKIKPIIKLKGSVSVEAKTIGNNCAIKHLHQTLQNADTNYPIVPSYTFNSDNLDKLIDKTDNYFYPFMIEKDDLDPAVACHWGPNAFGYVFVEMKNNW